MPRRSRPGGGEDLVLLERRPIGAAAGDRLDDPERAVLRDVEPGVLTAHAGLLAPLVQRGPARDLAVGHLHVFQRRDDLLAGEEPVAERAGSGSS